MQPRYLCGVTAVSEKKMCASQAYYETLGGAPRRSCHDAACRAAIVFEDERSSSMLPTTLPGFLVFAGIIIVVGATVLGTPPGIKVGAVAIPRLKRGSRLFLIALAFACLTAGAAIYLVYAKLNLPPPPLYPFSI